MIIRQSGAKEEEVLDALTRALRLTPAEVARIAEGLQSPSKRFVWVRRLLSEKEMTALREARVSQYMRACAFAPQRAQAAGRSAEETLASLAEILRLSAADKRRIKEAAATGERIWIRRRLSDEEREALRAARIPGVYIPRQSGPLPGLLFQPSYRRFYPGGGLASHVLGFCDIDGRGREGLEGAWHAFLAAVPAEQTAMRDACRRPLVDSGQSAEHKRQGQTLELTLCSAVQRIAEEELGKAVERYRPLGAYAVVMEPRSGDILAWACWPDYDPNHPGAAEGKQRLNGVIATVFEPGSTFKPFVWAAALEEKAIAPETHFFCENGSWSMPNGRVLHDVHGYGDLTAEMVLVKSSNIGMAKIAALLGAARLHRWIRAFGFGEITGVPLAGELAGTVHPLPRWTSYSMGSLPMGQEITVTLLQLASAYCAIANGGMLVKPRLVKAIRDAEGEIIHEVPTAVRRRVLREDTAAALRRILRRVVSEGTGKAANMPEYPLAGKTGTAQLKVNAEEYRAGMRGYSRTRFLSSFVGMGPAAEPRIVVAVAVREPQGAYYGGTVAAPVVRDIARRTLLYLGVPPAAAAPAAAEDSVLPVD